MKDHQENIVLIIENVDAMRKLAGFETDLMGQFV